MNKYALNVLKGRVTPFTKYIYNIIISDYRITTKPTKPTLMFRLMAEVNKQNYHNVVLLVFFSLCFKNVVEIHGPREYL